MVSRKRHFAKSVSWRVLGTLDTMLLAWVVTGDPLTGFTIGVLEIFTKLFLYYGHERVWYKFSKFGVSEGK